MSTPLEKKPTALTLPDNLGAMTVDEVKQWCENNWDLIKAQHITLANIKVLLAKFSNHKSVPNKTNGIACLLAVMQEEEGEEKKEEEGGEEEVEEEVEKRRQSAMKGKKQVLPTEEDKGGEEMELKVQPKSPKFQLPTLKKAHTTARTKVKLPDPDLPLPEKAALCKTLI